MKRFNNNLRLENLENRRMMAGDVSAYVDRGDLVILGDAEANSVMVSEVSDGEYAVIGLHHDGEATLINGAKEATFTGVTDDVHVALREGDDRFEFNNSRQTDMQYYPEGGYFPESSEVPDDLRIHGQVGNDEVKLSNVNVGDDIYLYTQEGADTVDLDNVRTNDRLWVSTTSGRGDSGDEVQARLVSAGGQMKVTTGSGDDTVEFKGQNSVSGNLDIDTGSGADAVNILDESVWYRHMRVHGDLDIETGTGDDSVFMRDVEARQDMNINTNDGNDVVTVNDSTVGYHRNIYTGNEMHAGSLNVNGGADRDSVNLYRNETANGISVDLGEGDNQAWVGYNKAGVPDDFDDAPQDANIHVQSGSGRDQVSFTRNEATDTIMSELGFGNDGLYASFNEAETGHFDMGPGVNDMITLWQNDFDNETVLNPLFGLIGVPIWP